MTEKHNKKLKDFGKKVTEKYLKAIKYDTEHARELYCKSSTDYSKAS